MQAHLALREAAAIYGVSEKTIRRHLPVLRIGRRVVVARSDLENLTKISPAPKQDDRASSCLETSNVR